MTSPNTVTPNPLPSVPNPTPMNPVMPAPAPIPMAPASLPPNFPPTPPKKKSNIFLIFFLVITLTLVIGVLLGYYLSSTNSIPDIDIPGVTQTPEASPTVTLEEPTTTPDVNNLVTPTPIVLSKAYEATVLPWKYSFNYPSDWTESEISKQDTRLTMSFAKDHTGCASGEVICSLVFAVNVAAEMQDPTVSTTLSSESIVIQNEGPVTITLYQYISNGHHFYMIPIRNGWIMANVAAGKDEEAGTLFRQILASFISEESPNAL